MSPVLILMAILLPVAGGALLVASPGLPERNRRTYLEVNTCLTSLLVWAALLRGSCPAFSLYYFPRGFSVDFHVDGLTMVFAGMISVMWPLVTLYAFDYMFHVSHRNSFFGFYLMTYGVTLGLAFSASILTMYVFCEMLTLVTIPLVWHYRDHQSMYAARVYAVFLIGGAALGFIAVLLVTLGGGEGIFRYGGSLLGEQDRSLMCLVYLFGFFGFGCKAAVFPLFYWLPTASVAPTPVTALLHAVAVVNSGVFAVTRLTWYSIGPDLLRGTWVQYVTMTLASFGLLFSAVLALRERHFKRRLACSTVSNLSYMLFGITLMVPEGLVGGVSHMVFHGIIKMSLFLCAGAFMHMTGNEYIYEINGVGKRMPVTFGLFTLSALSLIGVPLGCGFVSKLRLIYAGIAEGSGYAVFGNLCLIGAAFLCAMYTLTITVRAFFPLPGSDRYPSDGKIHEAGWRMMVPIGIFSALNILLGVAPGPFMRLLESIGAGLL